MRWHGYAALHLKINQLKPFQIEALKAYTSGKDVAVLQATSTGKSVCFQLPALMLQHTQYGLIIVPTLSLGLNIEQDFEEMKVSAIFLHGKSSPGDRKKAFGVRSGIKCIIATPETVFGTSENFKGILDKIDATRLASHSSRLMKAILFMNGHASAQHIMKYGNFGLVLRHP